MDTFEKKIIGYLKYKEAICMLTVWMKAARIVINMYEYATLLRFNTWNNLND